MASPFFLPGVPERHILQRLEKAGGKEVESGKLASPESSAALAVNCVGWFIHHPQLLPTFPGLDAAFPACSVDVEYQARFPWAGGRHPWLDAVVITNTHLIGIESKRFEPFRDKKKVSLSPAYDRPVWGDAMRPYERLRDRLRSGEIKFQLLDSAQLVKHAFGLVTDARRHKKRPVLVYLYAEPMELQERPISKDMIALHRSEIQMFAQQVSDAEVQFHSLSYRDWLNTWPEEDASIAAHRDAVLNTFNP